MGSICASQLISSLEIEHECPTVGGDYQPLPFLSPSGLCPRQTSSGFGMRFALCLHGTVGILLKAGAGASVGCLHAVTATLRAEMSVRLPKLVGQLRRLPLKSCDVGPIPWVSTGDGFLTPNLAFLRSRNQVGMPLLRPIPPRRAGRSHCADVFQCESTCPPFRSTGSRGSFHAQARERGLHRERMNP